jgi:hypothetical protein
LLTSIGVSHSYEMLHTIVKHLIIIISPLFTMLNPLAPIIFGHHYNHCKLN